MGLTMKIYVLLIFFHLSNGNGQSYYSSGSSYYQHEGDNFKTNDWNSGDQEKEVKCISCGKLGSSSFSESQSSWSSNDGMRTFGSSYSNPGSYFSTYEQSSSGNVAPGTVSKKTINKSVSSSSQSLPSVPLVGNHANIGSSSNYGSFAQKPGWQSSNSYYHKSYGQQPSDVYGNEDEHNMIGGMDNDFHSQWKKMRNSMLSKNNANLGVSTPGQHKQTMYSYETKYVNGKPHYMKKEEKIYKDGKLIHNVVDEKGPDDFDHSSRDFDVPSGYSPQSRVSSGISTDHSGNYDVSSDYSSQSITSQTTPDVLPDHPNQPFTSKSSYVPSSRGSLRSDIHINKEADGYNIPSNRRQLEQSFEEQKHSITNTRPHNVAPSNNVHKSESVIQESYSTRDSYPQYKYVPYSPIAKTQKTENIVQETYTNRGQYPHHNNVPYSPSKAMENSEVIQETYSSGRRYPLPSPRNSVEKSESIIQETYSAKNSYPQGNNLSPVSQRSGNSDLYLKEIRPGYSPQPQDEVNRIKSITEETSSQKTRYYPRYITNSIPQSTRKSSESVIQENYSSNDYNPQNRYIPNSIPQNTVKKTESVVKESYATRSNIAPNYINLTNIRTEASPNSRISIVGITKQSNLREESDIQPVSNVRIEQNSYFESKNKRPSYYNPNDNKPDINTPDYSKYYSSNNRSGNTNSYDNVYQQGPISRESYTRQTSDTRNRYNNRNPQPYEYIRRPSSSKNAYVKDVEENINEYTQRRPNVRYVSTMESTHDQENAYLKPSVNRNTSYAYQSVYRKKYLPSENIYPTKWIETNTTYKYVNGMLVGETEIKKFYENGILLHQNATERTRQEMEEEGIDVRNLDLNPSDFLSLPVFNNDNSLYRQNININRNPSAHSYQSPNNIHDSSRVNKMYQENYHSTSGSVVPISTYPAPIPVGSVRRHEIEEKEEYINGKKVYDFAHERKYENGKLIHENKTELGNKQTSNTFDNMNVDNRGINVGVSENKYINNNYNTRTYKPLQSAQNTGIAKENINKLYEEHYHSTSGSAAPISVYPAPVPIGSVRRHEVEEKEEYINGQKVYDFAHERKYENGNLIHENKTEVGEEQIRNSYDRLDIPTSSINSGNTHNLQGYSSTIEKKEDITTGVARHPIAQNRYNNEYYSTKTIPIPVTKPRSSVTKHEYLEEEKFINGKKVYDREQERKFRDGELIRENKVEYRHDAKSMPRKADTRYSSLESASESRGNKMRTSCITCGSLSEKNYFTSQTSTGSLLKPLVNPHLKQQNIGKGESFRHEVDIEEVYENGELVKGKEKSEKWKNGQLLDKKDETYNRGPSRVSKYNYASDFSRNNANLDSFRENESTCDVNPCSNEASCKKGTSSTPVCLCKFGFKGTYCETAYCPRRFCRYGGSCSIQNGRHSCECKDGYAGYRCNTKIHRIRASA